MVEELGTTFGRFVTADCDRDGLCVRDYMWIKIGIDIYQPLRKGIQYERFSTFCYLYGRLDHKGVHCLKYVGGVIDDRLSPFGGWLRAGQEILDVYGGDVLGRRGCTRSKGKCEELRCLASDFALGGGGTCGGSGGRWWGY
ncbi:hypothetical protein ACFX15_031582 [Malus domestica]